MGLGQNFIQSLFADALALVFYGLSDGNFGILELQGAYGRKVKQALNIRLGMA